MIGNTSIPHHTVSIITKIGATLFIAENSDIPTTPTQVFANGLGIVGTASYPDGMFRVSDGIAWIGDNGGDVNNTFLVVDDTSQEITFSATAQISFASASVKVNGSEALTQATGLAIDGGNAVGDVNIGSNNFSANRGIFGGTVSATDVAASGNIAASGAITSGGKLVLTIASLEHIVLTPINNDEVVLAINKYNIINTSTLTYLAFAISGTPQDNDVIKIKFVSGLQNFDWYPGTLAGSIYSANPGDIIELTYDLATDTWY